MDQEWQYLHWKTSYFRRSHIYITHWYLRGTEGLAIASITVLLLCQALVIEQMITFVVGHSQLEFEQSKMICGTYQRGSQDNCLQ
jgi:hypothetical protein